MTASRRVYVSADLEGVAGVVSTDELQHGGAEFEAARRLMTEEVNALVRGVAAGDPAAEIVVADSHGTYRNILLIDLDPRASLLRGKPRPLGMVDGVEAGDGVIFLGYHGRAGVPGTLSHTFSSALADVRLNGRSFGETGLNAAAISALGARMLLVSGNDAATREIEDLSPSVPTVVTSRTVSATAAISEHPHVVRQTIEDAAKDSVRRWDGRSVSIPGAVVLEIDLVSQSHADLVSMPPPVNRTGATSVRIEAADVLEAYRWVRTAVVLGTF